MREDDVHSLMIFNGSSVLLFGWTLAFLVFECQVVMSGPLFILAFAGLIGSCLSWIAFYQFHAKQLAQCVWWMRALVISGLVATVIAVVLLGFCFTYPIVSAVGFGIWMISFILSLILFFKIQI